jgi:hypothetical protein
MVNLSLKIHPQVLFCYNANHVDLTVRAENKAGETCWMEADVHVPEMLSVSPTSKIDKGRVRMGILGKKEFIEKSVKVYANMYTQPQIYRVNVIIYAYDKDGVISKRIEKSIDVRCELKKAEVL